MSIDDKIRMSREQLRTTDPTAFKIAFDPTLRRMSGVAIHGNTYFDVPFISEITNNLWIGGCENGLLLPEIFDHLISLYPWESYVLTKDLTSCLAYRLYDSVEDIDIDLIIDIATWVNVCRKSGPTLVHCQAGLNRSSLIAGMALILDGMTPEDTLKLLREKRSPAVLCNPAFERILLDWQ